jgi:hypothetical protein
MRSAGPVLSLVASCQVPPIGVFELGLACATNRAAQPWASEVYKQSFLITKNMHSNIQNLDMGTMTSVCIVIILSATCVQMHGLG